MRAQLDRQSVIHANAQFWEQMLAMTLYPLVSPGEFCAGSRYLLGCVTLEGVWKGRIEVRMSEGLAYQATAAMLMQPLEMVAETDALDATKEIANIIAGVIKSSLPRPCTMTVPESAVESEGFCSAAQTYDTLVVAFRHPSGDMMVRIWEQEYAQGC